MTVDGDRNYRKKHGNITKELIWEIIHIKLSMSEYIKAGSNFDSKFERNNEN